MPPATVPLATCGRACAAQQLRCDHAITSGRPRTVETATLVLAAIEQWPELVEIRARRPPNKKHVRSIHCPFGLQ